MVAEKLIVTSRHIYIVLMKDLIRDYVKKHRKRAIIMAYKVIILYQLYMPSYFLGTFTEYP